MAKEHACMAKALRGQVQQALKKLQLGLHAEIPRFPAASNLVTFSGKRKASMKKSFGNS